jgi:hypothetical protein
LVTVLGSSGPALALTGTLVLPGCFVFGSGPSLVGQGKQYQSGDAQYDEFFAQVYELQVELARAPDQEKKIRTDLATAVAVEGEPSPQSIGKKIRKSVEQLAAAGTGLKADINEDAEDDGEANAKIEPIGQPLTPTDEKLVRIVERGASDALALMVRMKKHERRLDKLRSHAVALQSNVDATFRKSVAKRTEVKKNLDDAQTMLPIMSTRARDVAEAAKAIAKQLEEAAHSDDGSFAPPPPPPEPEFEEEETPPAPPPAKPGAKPGAAAPKKPAPATGPNADFEP